MPGPLKPKIIDSFLRPMIDEFKILDKGISDVLDASTGEKFRLHAYLIAATADMPARDDLMGLKGCTSDHYCNYCLAKLVHAGEYSKGCPLTPPIDADQAMAQRKGWKKHFVGSTQRGVQQGERLPMRTHRGMKNDATKVEEGDELLPNSTSITRKSIFFELRSMIFPWSFPIDPMHNFYLNVAKHMRNHWLGDFFKWEESATGKANIKKDYQGRSERQDYLISKEDWDQMDVDLKKIKLPTCFGDKIRGIWEFRKANEWKTWVKVLMSSNDYA